MKPRKTKYMTAALDAVHIAEGQAWLEDMQADGWELESVGALIAYFKACAPAQMRYRIEYHKRRRPLPADQRQLYEDCGWTVVDDDEKTGRVIFRAPPDAAVPEIHTDGEEYIRRLRQANRKDLWQAVWWGLFCVAIFLAQQFITPHQWVETFCRRPVNLLLYPMGLILVGITARTVSYRRRQIQDITAQNQIPHREDWRKMRRLRVASVWVMIALLLVVWGNILFGDLPNMLRQKLAPEDYPAYGITIADFGKTSEINAYLGRTRYPLATEYRFIDSFDLSPIVDDLMQDETPSEEDLGAVGWIDGTCTQYPFTWLAAAGAREQAARLSQPQAYEREDLSAAWYGPGPENSRMFVAQRGKRVFSVSFDAGCASIEAEDIWDVLAEKLSQEEEPIS